MIRTAVRALLASLLATALLWGAAQHPLAGVWQEGQIGFRVTFIEQPGGVLSGTLEGQAGPMALDIASGPDTAQGTFQMEGETFGFAAQLQRDGATLKLWLYQVDAARQPVPGSYEEYSAVRLSPPPSAAAAQQAPPFGAPPAQQPPPFAGGAAQPPAAGGAAPSPAGAWKAEDIVGRWQSVEMSETGVMFTVAMTFEPGGTWRMDFHVGDEQIGYFGGDYSLAPDGALALREAYRSPQLCGNGRCEENTAPDTSGTDYLEFLEEDLLLFTDPGTGEATAYRRARVD